MNKHLEYASRIAYSSIDTLKFTYEQAKKYADKPGVYVECGVAAGAQIIAMASGAPNKTIYAFDSFEGIPIPSNRDDQMPGIKFLSKEEQNALPNPGEQILESSGATVVPLDDVKNHITDSGVDGKNIVFIKGWFEETVKHFQNDISILRLDGDLYNSTLVCLQHLYPKVVSGGIIIIDDYELPGCKNALNDYLTSIGHETMVIWFINKFDLNSPIYFYK